MIKIRESKGEKMKIKNVFLAITFIFMVASLGCIGEKKEISDNSDKIKETSSVKEMVQDKAILPTSLDKYYEKEPVYLFKMFDLGGAFMGIIVNFQQNDVNNTKTSFDRFSQLYIESSNLVPEWNGYYDIDAVDKLGKAIDSGDPGQIFPALDRVGITCTNCHKAEKPSLWAKYNWKDFRNIKISTGNPQEPELPWSVAKIKYLTPAFDGTMINIKENQTKDVIDSWKQFNTMFFNMEKGCLQCHSEPPRYFVSQDVKSLIIDVEKQITTGKLDDAYKNIQKIGTGCYKCHVIHEPAQRIKESLK